MRLRGYKEEMGKTPLNYVVGRFVTTMNNLCCRKDKLKHVGISLKTTYNSCMYYCKEFLLKFKFKSKLHVQAYKKYITNIVLTFIRACNTLYCSSSTLRLHSSIACTSIKSWSPRMLKRGTSYKIEANT